MYFICTNCRTATDPNILGIGIPPIMRKIAMHSRCKGGTWCDCQHRIRK